jgi:hypothetical protein
MFLTIERRGRYIGPDEDVREDEFKAEKGGMKYFLCVLGMVLIVEGLPYFAFPDRMKAWLVTIAAASDGHLRKIGMALMAVGLWLVYMGRS